LCAKLEDGWIKKLAGLRTDLSRVVCQRLIFNKPWLTLPFAAFGLISLAWCAGMTSIWRRLDLLWSLHLAFSWLVIFGAGFGALAAGTGVQPANTCPDHRRDGR
jgi:hypothetical protein